MNVELAAKLDELRAVVRSMGSTLVAYSGGVDSALVLSIAHEQLGPRALACIAVSPSYPRRELRSAVRVARAIGARYRLIRTQEHRDPRYLANAPDRCYFCKYQLYEHLAQLAARERFAAILNGTHADDAGDHVFGMAAAERWGIRAPLLEAGLGKPHVRALARHLGLAVWDKPASPCLSSRIPHGTAITPQLLRQIEQAEDAMIELGFGRFRVRHDGANARIELPVDEMERALKCRQALLSGIRAAGFARVSLDLTGLREEVQNTASLVPLRVRVSRGVGPDRALGPEASP